MSLTPTAASVALFFFRGRGWGGRGWSVWLARTSPLRCDEIANRVNLNRRLLNRVCRSIDRRGRGWGGWGGGFGGWGGFGYPGTHARLHCCAASCIPLLFALADPSASSALVCC